MGVLDLANPFSQADRLRIESWAKEEDRKNSSTTVFDAFINPDEINLNYSVYSDRNTAQGRTGNAGAFLGTAPFEITLKFFLDGTNATGVKLEVAEKIVQFHQTTGYDGKNHRTRYLTIKWAGFTWYRPNQFSFDCILKSANIQYKLFDREGKPKRAIITATFIEKRPTEEVLREQDDQSSDLTHVRIIKEGDTLPSMVYEIYGDLKYYLEVAKINQLKNFRMLSPGQKLIFPPFEKS